MPDWLKHALDPLAALCPSYCLQFWEVVGVWVAGLATFAAVVTSLWIAFRSERVRLRVSASFSHIYADHGEIVHGDCIGISALNFGLRRADLDGFFWGIVGREPGMWPLIRSIGMSDHLPKQLHDQESATQIFGWDALAPVIVDTHLRRVPRIMVRLLRVYASVRTGEMIAGRLSKELRRELVKLARKRNRERGSEVSE